MTRWNMVGLACAGAVLAAAAATFAQRGMGDETGVVRGELDTQRVTLAGKINKVITEPCGKTTGRYPVGTHFLLKTEDGSVRNVHLGPAALVEDLAKRLESGRSVSVEAFRTEKMPDGHYVAITVEMDGETVELRGEDLRPTWAGSQARQAARGNRDADRTLPGRGKGWALGQRGRLREMASPPGRGTGRGYGRGMGAGCRGGEDCWMRSRQSGCGPGPRFGRGCGAGSQIPGAGRARHRHRSFCETVDLELRLNAMEQQLKDLQNRLAADKKAAQARKPVEKQ